VVGKYTESRDSYKSIHEALVHGGNRNEAGLSIHWIASDRSPDQEAAGELLAGYDGLMVPGGFGAGASRDAGGESWAREHKLPFFGICLGLQTALSSSRETCARSPTPTRASSPSARIP